jgi:hypothetical protein
MFDSLVPEKRRQNNTTPAPAAATA